MNLYSVCLNIFTAGTIIISRDFTIFATYYCKRELHMSLKYKLKPFFEFILNNLDIKR